jgi:glycosyltransferase involved in cell wall biosynthesis
MPPGITAWVANQAVRVMNNVAALATHRIVTYTRDYAENSAYLRRYIRKLHVIPPPVELPKVSIEAVRAFSAQHNPQGKSPVIGMVARLATEKGVEILLGALPRILDVYPNALVQFAGPYQNIIGEEAYYQRLLPMFEKYQASGNWQFVGSLNPDQVAAFFPNLNVHVLPSLNSTEAFGLVQIEGMINGVPSVASDLPGVRQPVKQHGMGCIVPVGDPAALAEAVLEVLAHPGKFRGNPAEIARRYDPDSIAAEYEILFAEMQHELQG